jgi:ABC transporter with metal-binding/Fe-S-binding domain ATP-binding protein
MKLAALFSGGKDSCLALHRAAEYHEIACIVTLIPENRESYMFHTVNIELTEMQAKAMGIPIIQKRTAGEKEKELIDLKKALEEAIERFAIQGVVTGAIRSIYQASRIQRICNELGLICFNPLWLHDDMELLKRIIAQGFDTIITGVFAYPLSEEFLGKRIDERVIEELRVLKEKYKISAAGEGGELETFVVDAPLFKKRIEVVRADKRYKNNVGVFEIKEARLIEK